MEVTITSLLLAFLVVIQGISFIRSDGNQTHIQNENFNKLEHLVLHENIPNKTENHDESHIRVKRQFYYPYGYYRRPLPIIFGGGGFGIIGPGYGRGYGFGRGFGGRGFGGRGFGGRGFGGRGFGGRGFGGRGFGGIGGHGIGGMGGHGGRG